MDEKERRYWDNFIRNLCDLNYIKPFRHLIHYMLHNIRVLQDEVAAFGDYVTEDVFEELVKRVTTAEEEIKNLEENKAEKADVEKLEGRVDDAEEAIDALSEELGDVTGNVGSLAERMTAAEENIENLEKNKAEKSDLETFEAETNAHFDTLDKCCTEVQEHLTETDKRLDTDEENIDTLLDNMIIRSDHLGVIATDNYFDDYLDVDMDGLVREMSEQGVMKYEIYTAYYPEHDANWVSQIHDAVKEIYDWEWENNFAFIQVDTILFGGTSPRIMVTLIPRERDVYICLCYHVGDIAEAFDGHCFIHRTPTEALEERIAACEERLDVVEDMLATLAEADRLIAERVSALEERADATDQTLADHDKRIDAVQSEADANAEDITNLKGCCQAVNATLADYNDRITAAQNTADTAEGKADHNAEDISHLEDDISDIRTRIGNSIVRITPGYSTSDTGVTETVTFTDNNGAEVKTYSGSVTGLSCDVKETDNNDTVYTITAYYLADELGTTDTYTYTITVPAGYDDSALREEIDKLEKEFGDLAAQVDQIASETDGIGDRVDKVEKSVESLTGDVADLEGRMAGAEESIDDLEQVTGENKEAISDLTDAVRENTSDIETIFDTPLELTGTLAVDPVEFEEGGEYTAALTDTSIINLKGDQLDAEEYILDHDLSQIDAYFALNSVRRFKISQTADGTDPVTDTIEDAGTYALDGQSAVLQYTDGSHRVIHNGVAGVDLTVTEKPWIPYAFYSETDNSLNFYATQGDVPEAGSTIDEKIATDIYTDFIDKDFSSTNTPWSSRASSVTDIYTDNSFTDNVQPTNICGYFSNFSKLTSLDGVANWNTSQLTTVTVITVGSTRTTKGAFYGCSGLTNLDGLANWDVSHIIRPEGLFADCSGLTNLDGLANWDVSNVTSLRYTFAGCSGLTNLDGLANWDVSKLLYMGYSASTTTNNSYPSFGTFYNCSGLTNLDGLANWDVSSLRSLYGTFYNCSGLTNLDGLANWDVSSLVNLQFAFYNCNKLTNVDGLANWDVSNVTSLWNTFYGCSNVESCDLSKLQFESVKITKEMFKSNPLLSTIYASDSSFNTEKIDDSQDMFQNCTALVGGAGTVYDEDHTDAGYAHIDGGEENPGYFTQKE